MFLDKSLELVELCLFLYPEQHFRFRTILTPVLTRKPHSFFFSNHQRLPKTFISHEKFGFLWICPEKRLLKPLKIAVFALKMTYFGYENGLSWIMPIFKLQIFLKILADNLISFQKPLYFFEKSLDLVKLCLLLYPEWHFGVRTKAISSCNSCETSCWLLLKPYANSTEYELAVCFSQNAKAF